MVKFALLIALNERGGQCSTYESISVTINALVSMEYHIAVLGCQTPSQIARLGDECGVRLQNRNIATVSELESALHTLHLNNLENLAIVVLGGDGAGYPLSSGERVGANAILSMLCSATSESAELLLIMEGISGGKCCLPYKLDIEGNFRLTGKMYTTLQSVLLFTCDCYSAGISTDDGEHGKICPLLSGTFSLLESGVNSLAEFSSQMCRNHQLPFEVYSTYPIPATLWNWIWNPNLEIYINQKLATLVLVRKTHTPEMPH